MCTGMQGSLELQQLDLADLSSVEALAQQLATEAKLDILILNAGVGNCPVQYTKDNFELQIGTNHFGHFHLMSQLLSKLQSQVGSSRYATGFATFLHIAHTLHCTHTRHLGLTYFLRWHCSSHRPTSHADPYAPTQVTHTHT